MRWNHGGRNSWSCIVGIPSETQMRSRYWVGIKRTTLFYPDNDEGLSKKEVKVLKQQLIKMKNLKLSDVCIIGVFEDDAFS